MPMIDPISSLMHRRAGRNGPAILMYHSIQPGSGRPDWTWSISLQRFCEQLDFLVKEGWGTTTINELTIDGKTPDRTVVITFDDGYEDNLAACEELHKRGMRATWFIASGSIGRCPGWPADGRPANRLLDASELREIAAAGMEIGSHTVNHIRLTVASDTEVKNELRASKDTLEDLLGHDIQSFAYPYGAWDMRCEAAVVQAGFLHACTCQTGMALKDMHPLRLRRLAIYNHDSASSLARKLALLSNDCSWEHVLRYYADRTIARIKGIK